jgi:hypothetical protein
MQQPQLTTYADITEVRTLTGGATCNQLLTEGWVLLGIYPLTTVADMTQSEAGIMSQKGTFLRLYLRCSDTASTTPPVKALSCY